MIHLILPLQSAAAVARDVGETLLCKARGARVLVLGAKTHTRMGEMGGGLMKS